MTQVNVRLLEEVMLEFATCEAGTEYVLPARELLHTPPATLEACLGVIAAIVKVANDTGLIPAAGDDTFYGLISGDASRIGDVPGDYDPGIRAARLAALRALTAAFNNDWESVTANLITQLHGSSRYGVATFLQLLHIWRSIVTSPEGAIAVQLMNLGTCTCGVAWGSSDGPCVCEPVPDAQD